MTTQNIFEYAIRNKLRFASPRGELSAEQLWDVPLHSKDDFNLNTVAKTANKALKDLSEESFVETKKTPEHTRREMALEIVKYVIDTKLAEEAAAEKRAANKQEKEKILAVLAEKQAGKLSELSEKELQKRIAALEA
jgi:DNA-binding PadR family transcriptional regulator